MRLKNIVKRNITKWHDDPYIYEKNSDGIYEYTTFGNFTETSLALANYFLSNGYKNKKIMIISENSTRLMEFDMAITFYTGVCAIVSKEWKVNDLLLGIEELKADLLIYSDRFKDMAAEVHKKTSIKILGMNDIRSKYKDAYLDLKIRDYNKASKIVFSSGTTGKSKAVMLSLKNIFAGYNSLIRRCSLSHKDSAYLFLPLNHTYAEVYNFMYSLVGGFSLYLASSTQNIGKELLETNPTVFCAVPLVFNNLLGAYGEHINMAFGKNIRYLFSGGAPISKETRQIYKDKGLFLMQAYALSETSSSLCIAYPGDDDLESVGTIFEDMDVKVDNPDKDGVGEIIVKGEAVFLGYTDPSLTKRVFDDKGYFHTGDLGCIKNHKIFLNGRKKKMLLSSNGENIMAESIENGIKSKDKRINDVKAYIKNDKLAVDIYSLEEIDVDKVVEEYNKEVPKYERVEIYKLIQDSIDVRLKQ